MSVLPLDIIPTNDCCGCEACANICSKGCIVMRPDKQGFLRPYFDNELCTHCNLCRKVCPITKERAQTISPQIFACKNLNDTIRAQSTSGGVFSSLAEYIITKGGIIYGATYNTTFEVEHTRIYTIEDLAGLRGSKYAQSHIGECFKMVKKDLQNGELVLFSGTPCQIAGLQSYLGKNYDKLYCIEVVCHGVPSPLIFRHYLNYLEKKYNARITSFCFRDKKDSWQRYSLSAQFDNGYTMRQLGATNSYQRGFIADLYTRPSCENCHFKSFLSGADLTLGDFWGSSILGNEYNDDRGISLVCINNHKGHELFNNIKNNNIDVRPSTLEEATRFNPCIIRSTTIHSKSTLFWDRYKNSDFDSLINNLLKTSKKKRLLTKFHSYLQAIKKYF